MDGDTANRDLDWLHAASTDRVFVFHIGEHGVTRQHKLDLVQRHFWPALSRWVLSRQLVLPGGSVVGGWGRADMQGMMDWYRECFHMTSRWDDAIVAHADGVWRVVLETSPWRDWPEFNALLREADRDRDPCADGMEDAFMDLWEEVANLRPLGAHGRGKCSHDFRARAAEKRPADQLRV